jgi:hypothetical protein
MILGTLSSMPAKPATPVKEAPKRKRVVRRTTVDVRTAVRSWLLATDAVERFSKDVSTHRSMILQALEEQGTTDDKGSQWLRFPDDPVEGRIKGVKRERRVSRSLDSEAAEAYLRERKIYDDCTETIVVLSEEKILDKNFKGEITDADLDKLYVVKETWALVPDRVKL